MKNANGLTLKTVKTTVTTSDGVFSLGSYDQLIQFVSGQFPSNGLVVAYLDYQVLVGKFQPGEFIFYWPEQFQPRYMQRVRIFNENQELLIWRRSAWQYQYRFRQDEAGAEKPVVDAEQVLWGTAAKDLDHGWSYLFEERGTQLVVPLANLQLEQKQHRVKIKTRNYIGFNEMGQAGYEDCRFIGLYEGGK